MLTPLLIGWLWQVAGTTQPRDDLTRLRQWVQAVQRHEPGRADAEAIAVAPWPGADLRATLAALNDLRDVLRRKFPSKGGFTSRDEIRTRGGSAVPAVQIQEMLGLSDDEARRGDFNRLLERGAVLHSDIAIMALNGALSATSGGAAPERLSIRIADGRREGFDDTTRHWEMARALLEVVTPEPARDEWVRLWYVAAAAYMRSRSILGAAEPMLDRARQLFPADAEILFYSGCLNEASASPAVQGALASIKLPQAPLPISRQPGTHRGAAVSFFRGALRVRPEWAEARARLGRVLGLLGRHNEAAAELGRALADTSHPTIIYYASLFLGDEEQALDHRERARECYERARTYRPRAQAPHLALSQLARREGDLALALAEVRTVLALSPDESGRYDPLWDYFVGQESQKADELFIELHRLLDKGRPPGEGAPR